MSSENLLHIKLDYQENLEGKGNLLYIESSLLKIVRAIKNYREIRGEELRLKQELGKKIKEYLSSLKTLKTVLPKQFLPKIKKEVKSEPVYKKEIKEIAKEEGDLEEQLREINRKLKLIKG